MILITGSTGHLGRAIISNLLKNGMPSRSISGFARNREKAENLKELGIVIKMGNYDDQDSLEKAFKDLEGLLFISGSEIEKRDKQHDNIINAAVKMKVPHILYTSFERKNDKTNSQVGFITRTHILTEKKIRETGIPYTFLRNALYAEGLPMLLGDKVLDNGIYLPAGNGRVPFASVADLAEATANIVAGTGHKNKSYHTVNIHQYSFYEIASILSEITGKNVKYFCPSPEEFTETMKKAGVPDKVISAVLAWGEGIKQGYFESEHSDLEQLLGHKPADLKTILSKIY